MGLLFDVWLRHAVIHPGSAWHRSREASPPTTIRRSSRYDAYRSRSTSSSAAAATGYAWSAATHFGRGRSYYVHMRRRTECQRPMTTARTDCPG